MKIFKEKQTDNLKDLKKEIEKRDRKIRRQQRFNKAIKWIDDHSELLIIAIPAGMTLAGYGFKLCKGITRNIALVQEKNIKDMRIYDRSLGKYLELKRPLKAKDMTIILERKDKGEKLSNILMDLKLLK